jgi:phage shock protein C
MEKEHIMQPRLTRSPTDRMLAGVCGGLGNYFGVDPVIVRLIFVVGVVTGITPFLYPVLWLITPQASQPVPLPPDARFDPMTGRPLPPQPQIGQTVQFQQYNTPAQGSVSPRNRNRTLGMFLMAIGSIILINTVDNALDRIFGVQLSGFVFPILLVGVGVYLLRKKTI